MSRRRILNKSQVLLAKKLDGIIKGITMSSLIPNFYIEIIEFFLNYDKEMVNLWC